MTVRGGVQMHLCAGRQERVGASKVITVADIMSLPSIRRSEMIAPCDGGNMRQVLNVGILDVSPNVNRYSAYMPGEFILTNLGFAVGDKDASDDALLTMIGRGVAGIGIKTVYDPYVSDRVREESTVSGVPVFLYEGSYHEAIVFDALALIRQDESDSKREGRIDSLIGNRSGDEVRADLFEIAGVTGASLQCLAIAMRRGRTGETSLHVVLSSLRALCSEHVATHDDLASEVACRYHDYLLLLVSRKSLPEDLAPDDVLISELHGLVESIGSFSCGVSEEVPLGDGDVAIRQALEAVSLAVDKGESLVRWSRLGWDAFAISARDGALFSRCCKVYQNKISAGDKRSELMRTVQRYAALHGDVGAVAEELCQHPNTIRYRLKKIKDLLGFADISDRELAALLAVVFLPAHQTVR